MNPRVLFIFLDGVGLGPNNPESNPLASARMPVLEELLGGQKLLEFHNGVGSDMADVYALDPLMGVDEMPQSASGQAALLTGKRIPALVGYHYGPKPNPEIANLIRESNIFSSLKAMEKTAALINAYPDSYFESIQSGKRLYSAVPLAVTSAGIELMDRDDYYNSRAISVDFTGEAWRTHLGYDDAPVRTELEAGAFLARLAGKYNFAFFEFWITDLLGHRQDMKGAIETLEKIDRIFAGLWEEIDWDDQLVVISSDHGNIEDLSTRRHTKNAVPAVVIGSPELRKRFGSQLEDLADVPLRIEAFLS